ncbi:MAG: tRNA (adenosine(37)-N6)-dimethylallyltransferase MiaA, partial [candidate division GAL15 bacterium]
MPLVVVVGPTAVGKSTAAVELAERLGGEVVCADSRTVYRGMDIGTAKPTPAMRARVPHHLLDVVDPTEVFTVWEFQRLASEAIAQIRARGRVPLLVGGTGLYVRAVVDGLVIPQVPP